MGLCQGAVRGGRGVVQHRIGPAAVRTGLVVVDGEGDHPEDEEVGGQGRAPMTEGNWRRH